MLENDIPVLVLLLTTKSVNHQHKRFQTLVVKNVFVMSIYSKVLIFLPFKFGKISVDIQNFEGRLPKQITVLSHKKK